MFYFLSVLIGILSAATGFMQSDTCWLVKLGQLILSTGCVPQHDPFSFTLPLLAASGFRQPFVVYQWLSEVIFAVTFQLFSLQGLILLSALLTALSSICLLFRVCLQASGKLFLSFVLVGLAAATIALRLMVRPEIFTLLFIVAYMFMLRRIGSKEAIDWRIVAGLMLAMIAWCNLHSGFIIGILTLAIYAGASLCEDKIAKRKISGKAKTTFAALVLCSFGTLLNPSGFYLWAYLPRVFLLPVNLSIREVQSLSPADLLVPIYYPLFALLAISIYSVFIVLKTGRGPTSKWSEVLGTPGRLSSIALILLAILASLLFRRLASPMALFLAFETSSLFGSSDNIRPAPGFFQKSISVLALEIPVLLLTTVGDMVSSNRLVSLTMPQATVEFQPPFKAVRYLSDNWKSGRIFNHAQIGSMLIMYGPPGLKVFIDTRMDVYGEMLIYDYCRIIGAMDQYKTRLDSYGIEWVIVRPSDSLGRALRHDPGWSKEFEDGEAVIFRRAK